MKAIEHLTQDERDFIELELKPEVRRFKQNPKYDQETIVFLLERAFKAERSLAEIAIRECDADIKQVRELRDPVAISGQRSGWFTGATVPGGAWESLRDKIASSGNWSQTDLQNLDQSSTRIVAELPAPAMPRARAKGLVVGYVQSGKTASYTSVISKAADAGYKLFIVVAGVTERLRQQTQRRLNRELIDLLPGQWNTITSTLYDFSAQHQSLQAPAILAENNGHFVLAVVKKNSTRLHRLTQWLETAHAQLRTAPVLIIDDEADEASINTSRQANSRSAINARLHTLVSLFPKVAYVAYTATPFANLLIPADSSQTESLGDLYPSDFIIDLPRPEAYVGAERIFGRANLPDESERPELYEGLAVLRTIPENEEAVLRVTNLSERETFTPPAVDSLVAAVKWFVIACAIRRARGSANEHMTMLVHTSQFTAVHQNTRETFKIILSEERARLKNEPDAYFAELERIWNEEHLMVESEPGVKNVEWFQVANEIQHSLNTIRIFVENGISQELNFDKETVHGIVIGGNVLSRGLTIEGLLVSYFIRTASTYDTLLQMGRWFGFRKGYLDISRIWMPLSLQRDFADLALVEEEIRTDIRRYRDEGLNPTQLAVRIRCHSTLLVTSKQKMRRAVSVSIGYAGREVSTRVFYRKNHDWLERGWAAGANLITRILGSKRPTDSKLPSKLFRNVGVEQILEFLDNYPVHPDCAEFRSDTLKSYILKAIEPGSDRLKEWNVAVMQREKDYSGSTEVSLGPLQVRLLNRSRIHENSGVQDEDIDYANIRALTSEGDAGIDLDGKVVKSTKSDRAKLLEARTEHLPSVGLLMLYPIDKDSKARSSKNRTDLRAAHHVLAAAIVFPGKRPTEGFLENDYVAADLSGATLPEAEEEDFIEDEDGVRVMRP